MRKQIQIVALATLMVLLGNTPGEAGNLLSSGDFEPSGGEVPEWRMEEFATGSGTAINAGELIGFAANTGTLGLWLRAFAGGQNPGPDNLINVILSQTVPGVVGETYAFSGFSKWETNYSGGVTTLTGGPLNGQASPTQTNLELAFLDGGATVIDTPITLDLSTEQMNDATWREHTLSGVAPVGTVSVRISAGMLDGINAGVDPQTAFFDDFSLELASSLPGDFNNDGVVDGNDLLIWESNFGVGAGGDADGDEDTDGNDFLIWQRHFGSGGVSMTGAIPEPSALALTVIIGMFAIFQYCRRRM